MILYKFDSQVWSTEYYFFLNNPFDNTVRILFSISAEKMSLLSLRLLKLCHFKEIIT